MEEPTTASATAEDAEVRIFVIDEHKVRTVTGDLLAVPKVSWGKERKVLYALRDLLKSIIESGVLSGATNEEEFQAKLIAFLFDKAPDILTSVVCELLGKDTEFVEANLEMMEMLGLVLPFLVSRRQALEAVLKPYLAGVAAQMRTAT